MSLLLMLQARRETQAQLNRIMRQIGTRAERRVLARRLRRRQPGSDTIPWSRDDERAYRAEIDALAFERAAEIEALTAKLEHLDRAIAIFTRRQDHDRIHA